MKIYLTSIILFSICFQKFSCNSRDTAQFITGCSEGFNKSLQQQQNSNPSSSLTIKSYIDGEFHGFEGDTIVQLTNGQVWQQNGYYYYYYYGYMLPVSIYKTETGYKMKVKGVDKAVSVVQLEWIIFQN